MHTTNLQSLISTTSRNIRNRQTMLDFYTECAKDHAKKGDKSLSLAAYKVADKSRGKLAKLVAMQCGLKVELQANIRTDRINRKIVKLQEIGFNYAKPELTSREIEDALDKLIAAFIPAKKDTRGTTSTCK